MKLLFDENLSPRLVDALVEAYPDSVHARDVGLRGAHDLRVWNFAKSQEYTIVSKDTDFRERSFVEGFPPKVIWLDVGNAGTDTIKGILLREHGRVETFHNQKETSLLILSIDTNAV